jgi:hypothetical protein
MILNEVRNPIIAWAEKTKHQFKANGYGRSYGILQNLSPPREVWDIKKHIINLYGLESEKQEPIYKDYCGFITEGGSIHSHKDPNEQGFIHTRFNVLLSKPLAGGEPVQEGNIISVEEGDIWRCDAGKVLHWSTPVVGNKPRIVLSFGFLLKE